MEIIQPAINKLSANKFLVILTIPEILKKLNRRNIHSNKTFNLDTLQFSLRNITIPKTTVPAHPLHTYGQTYNISSYDKTTYDPCTMNFEIDNEFKNYWVLWQWLQLLNHNKDSMFASPKLLPNGIPDDIVPKEYNYVTDIIVFALDEYNNRKVKFTFLYAFPTSISEIKYDYRDIKELTCTFTFVFNQLNIELLCGTDGINCDE